MIRALRGYRRTARTNVRNRIRPDVERLERRHLLTAIAWAIDADGNWDNPTNWSPQQIPGSGDDVTIDRGAANPNISINNSQSVRSIVSAETLLITTGSSLRLTEPSQLDGALTLQGGLQLDGAGNLTVGATGSIDWQSGAINGGAQLINHGAILISSATDVSLGGRLSNFAVIEHAGAGNLSIGGALTNEAGGEYDFRSDAGFTGNGTIFNSGTIVKSDGGGVSRIGPSLNSDLYFHHLGGAIDAQSGTIRLDALRGDSTGATWNASAGATVELVAHPNGHATYRGTYTGTGDGQVELSGGYLETSNPGGATFSFAPGVFRWTGGAFGGSTTRPVTNVGQITLDGAGDKAIANTFVNEGTVVQRGAGNLIVNGALTIAATGVYDFQGDGDISGNGRIDSSGAIRKTEGGTTSIAVEVDTSATATFESQVGRLQLAGGGFLHGNAFHAAVSAVVELGGGAESFLATGNFSGSGGGRVEITAPNIASVDDGVAGAHATFDFPAKLLHWLAGGISSGGCGSNGGCSTTLVNAGHLTISGPAAKGIGGTGMINTGTIIDIGPGSFALNGSTFDNRVNALFELRGDVDVPGRDQFGNAGTFINSGVLAKTAGAGRSQIDAKVDVRRSLIEVRSGRLELPVRGDWTGGTFVVDSGAVLDVGGNFYSLSGEYTGSGGGVIEWRPDFSGQNEDPAVFDFPPGMMHWIDAGAFGTIINRNSITVSGAGGTFCRCLIVNEGEFTHEDDGAFVMNPDARFENRGLYDLTGDGDIIVPPSASVGTATFLNTGELRKSGGAGMSEFRRDATGGSQDLRFDNEGAVDVRTGTLSLQRQVAQVTGATLGGGTWRIGPNATLAMPDQPALSTSRADITLEGVGSTFSRIHTLADNQGRLAILNGRDFATVGNLTNSGSLTVGVNSTLQINGTFSKAGPSGIGVQIGGPSASGQFGRIHVSGQADLTGALRVDLVDGFGPLSGDAYTIATYPSRSGTSPAVGGLGGFFDAVVTSTAVTLNAVGSAADIAILPFLAPLGGEIGQSVEINYIVQELDGIAVAGDWTDSIYLSRDAALSGDDVLVGRALHVGGIDANGQYNGSLAAALPAIIDGDYRVLVVSDSQREVPDVDRGNNVAASANTLRVTVPWLAVGGSVTTTIRAGQDAYYRVEPTVGAGDLILDALFAVANQADVFLRRLDLPASGTFDASAVDGAGLARRIELLAPQGGSHYVLIRGRAGAATPQSYTLSARQTAFELRGVAPARGSSLGKATVTVDGSGFTPLSTVELVAADASVRAAQQVQWRDGQTLYATFDLQGLAAGTYDVRVRRDSGSAILANAFTVTSGPAGRLATHLSAPTFIRPFRENTLYVEYRNEGETDIVPPLMLLSAKLATLRLPSQTTAPANSLMLLGIADEGPANVLAPGASGRIAVKYSSTTGAPHALVDFSLKLREESGSVDLLWDSVKDGLRPAGIPADVFDAVFANFRAAVGDTWEQLNATLAADSGYLGRLGKPTHDASLLFMFELMQAGFTTIEDRYTLGAMGRGRVGFWESRIIAGPGNRFTLVSGAHEREFLPNGDGTFRGLENDTSVLSFLPGGLARIRESDGRVSAFLADGRLDFFEDRNGNRATLHWNGANPDRIDFANGEFTQLLYEAHGRLRRVVEPGGRVHDFTYDASGEHLLSVTGPAGTTQFTYVTGQGPAREHALASATYPDGSHLFQEYDDRGRLLRNFRDGNLESVTFEYDSAASTTVVDDQGNRSRILQDQFGRPAQLIDPLGNVTHYHYDQNNFLVGLRNVDGLTSFERDTRGHIVATTNPLGQRTRFTYDAQFGELTRFENAAGIVTTYGLDARGNRTSESGPYGVGVLQDNLQGQVRSLTTFAGENVTRTFDARGLLVHQENGDGYFVDFSYDAQGNLVSAVESDGDATTFDYDAAERLDRVTYPTGLWLAYTYDAAGRRSGIETSDGFEVRYEYDSLGRLVRVRDGGGGQVAEYVYSNRGGIAETRLGAAGNGPSIHYAYDALGNVASIVNRASDQAIVSQFAYAYDAMGRRTSMTTSEGVTSYAYDATGQLVSAELPDGRLIRYAYDALGNRVSSTDDGVTTAYLVNARNQYESAGAATFTHDADGRLTSRSDATGTTTYVYNSQGRLAAVHLPGGRSVTYEYDGLGTLLAITRDGVRSNTLFDPTGLNFLVGEYDAANAAVAHYTLGQGLTSRIAANGNAGYYVFDGGGNVAQLLDPTGAVLNEYSYLPFGELRSSSTSVPNPFQFNGQLGVHGTGDGLLTMSHRSYDPASGRFTQLDPLGLDGGDANFYRFVGNDPVNSVDPLGLSELIVPDNLYRVNTPGGPRIVQLPRDSDPADILGQLEHPTEYLRTGRDYAGIGAGGGIAIEVATGAVSRGAKGLATAVDPVRVVQERLAVLTKDAPWTTKTGVKTGIMNNGTLEAGFARAGSRVAVVGESLGLAMVALSVGDLVNLWEETSWEDDPYDVFDKDALDSHLTVYVAEILKHRSEVVLSGDPNEIIGPAGYGAARFMTTGDLLPYSVHFENFASASAPAQEVVVTEQLDTDLDFASFELARIGFGDTVVDVPTGLSSFRTRVDATASVGVWVDIDADFNVTTGQLQVRFGSIDPKTGDVVTDALAGFLPPNATSPQGQGFVDYVVRAKPSLATGTELRAVAAIVFDDNPPITTNQVDPLDPGAGLDPDKEALVTIDSGAPTSSVAALPSTIVTRDFTVSWSGTDDAGGSGRATYDVYVSTDAGPYVLWVAGTTSTSRTFDLPRRHTYAFHSRARDNVGLRESAPLVADAQAFFHGPPWQNPRNRLDVDNRGTVESRDALLVITQLNEVGGGPVDTSLPLPPDPADFLDVSGDNVVSSLDALLVINAINGIGDPEPEGESTAELAGMDVERVPGSAGYFVESIPADRVDRRATGAPNTPANPWKTSDTRKLDVLFAQLAADDSRKSTPPRMRRRASSLDGLFANDDWQFATEDRGAVPARALDRARGYQVSRRDSRG